MHPGRDSSGFMAHPKDASLDHPINPLLANRFSPYVFDADRDVSTDDLLALLEAARWAPSSYNEQPWRYLIARKSESAAFAQLLSCLVEANQAWAKFASVLLIGLTVNTFSRNGKPNKAAHHDLGLASANLSLEATARGLHVHQMIGIDPERARAVYRLPAHVEALTGIAVGYAGTNSQLPAGVADRDQAPRSRHPRESFVFGAAWDTPWKPA